MSGETIVLVGPMGVGKTTVGKKLATLLEMEFCDTDRLFTDRFGSISEFFAEAGEQRFRELEKIIVAEAISRSAVVATGGGVVLCADTREKLSKTTVIYLKTDGTHMANRLSQGKRPLIENGLADWKRIYDDRKALYEQVADITIDCSGQPIRETVSEIRQALGK